MLKTDLGIEPEMVIGRPGEFTVLVDGAPVARKWLFFPSGRKCVDAVRHAVNG